MDLLNQVMAEKSVIVASDEGHISDSVTEGASARTSGSYSFKRALTDSDRRSLVKNEETACSIELPFLFRNFLRFNKSNF